MGSGIRGKLGALMLKPTLKETLGHVDQSTYGGAVLLGTKAPVVKAHGASDARTVFYTIKQIKAMIEGNMIPNFVTYFADQQKQEEN